MPKYTDSIFPNILCFMTRIYYKLTYSLLENLVLKKDRCQNLRIYYVRCREVVADQGKIFHLCYAWNCLKSLQDKTIAMTTN